MGFLTSYVWLLAWFVCFSIVCSIDRTIGRCFCLFGRLFVWLVGWLICVVHLCLVACFYGWKNAWLFLLSWISVVCTWMIVSLYGCMAVCLCCLAMIVRLVLWLYACVAWLWLYGCRIVVAWLYDCTIVVIWLYGYCMIIWFCERIIVWLCECLPNCHYAPSYTSGGMAPASSR